MHCVVNHKHWRAISFEWQGLEIVWPNPEKERTVTVVCPAPAGCVVQSGQVGGVERVPLAPHIPDWIYRTPPVASSRSVVSCLYRKRTKQPLWHRTARDPHTGARAVCVDMTRTSAPAPATCFTFWMFFFISPDDRGGNNKQKSGWWFYPQCLSQAASRGAVCPAGSSSSSSSGRRLKSPTAWWRSRAKWVPI